MTALAKIRDAGFTVLLDGDALKIRPSAALTDQQRMFLKTNKAEVIAELRQEQEQEQEQEQAANDQPKTEVVCCGDCRHSVLPPDTEPLYGWRSCGLGLADGGGFGRAHRRCTQFSAGEIQKPKTDPLATQITELMALGWSELNARARAESEALPDWITKS